MHKLAKIWATFAILKKCSKLTKGKNPPNLVTIGFPIF
jgi:hypothetical protein